MSEVVATAQQGLAGKYKPYPQYKDSGVEWLGVIPTHWSLHALKRTVSGCSNGIWGDEPKGEDDLIVLRVADFDRNKLTVSDDKLTYRSISEKERKTRLLKKGDLLIEKSGGGEKTLVGCVVIFDKDYSAVTSNFVAKMSPRKTYCSNFLRYAFSHLYAGRVNYPSIKQTTGIQNLDSDSYLMEHFCFPDSSDQQTIAAFLDYETARIDRLIAQQQRLIELLKEKRQAVISHAVTKGLNPDVPMKDSGVEWLGQVPEHWALLKFNHCASIRNGQVDPTISPYDDYILIAPNHIESGTGRILYMQTAEEQGADSGKYICKKGEVIYSKIRPALVKVCLSPEKHVICSADMYPICGRNGLENDFLLWFLLSDNFTRFAVNQADRVAMPKINRDSLSESRIPVPPKEEQVEIASFLNRKTGMLDTLIEKSVKAITLMQERRTALISAAVTGKIDLRGWTPPAEEVAA
ncbi:restriction endonuclease subunit S [Aeromonas caviae]|uniref:restriction endonuclease subunit S n=1 Tax=Aeromonas caviae TaxID=648 RepID=UPI00191EACE8|nr:restriction endonuclease subunit S [Aeromonas caviae]MBL0651697.1 restriction endonuclease subunit S [Aeromonas caviae]